MHTVVLIEGRQDRAAVLEMGNRVVIVVADGAGGTGDGARAAETLVAECRAAVGNVDPVSMLARADRLLARAGGQTTGVVIVVTDAEVRGASVGDSEAWVFDEGGAHELTDGQRRKPLLGSGSAEPVAFGRPRAGTLVVATDGLWKYARRERIAALAAIQPLDEVPAKLVGLVRLRTGVLPDDVAIVVCR